MSVGTCSETNEPIEKRVQSQASKYLVPGKSIKQCFKEVKIASRAAFAQKRMDDFVGARKAKGP